MLCVRDVALKDDKKHKEVIESLALTLVNHSFVASVKQQQTIVLLVADLTASP